MSKSKKKPVAESAPLDWTPKSEAEIRRLCGWIPPQDRTAAQHQASQDAIGEMPKFQIFGKSNDAKRVVLWDCSKIVNNGKHFLVFDQKTGSCVGNGLGQAVWYLSAVEVVRLKDPEQALLPFYLLPYGRSRLYAGMRGPGEGSLGSAAAKAIRVDGILPADTEGLPKSDDQGGSGITWGERAEMEWSDGEAISQDWLNKSKKHLVQTAAQIQSADDARAALQNYYPLTIASDWGGRMECRAEGTPPVLLNERSGSWSHQMSCHGWQEHPQLGELFYVLNSWSTGAHGTPSDDSPPGGFWIRRKDMEYIIRQEETFALSQFQGFPGQPNLDLDWTP